MTAIERSVRSASVHLVARPGQLAVSKRAHEPGERAGAAPVVRRRLALEHSSPASRKTVAAVDGTLIRRLARVSAVFAFSRDFTVSFRCLLSSLFTSLLNLPVSTVRPICYTRRTNLDSSNGSQLLTLLLVTANKKLGDFSVSSQSVLDNFPVSFCDRVLLVWKPLRILGEPISNRLRQSRLDRSPRRNSSRCSRSAACGRSTTISIRLAIDLRLYHVDHSRRPISRPDPVSNSGQQDEDLVFRRRPLCAV